MSIPVAIDDLAQTLHDFGHGYLLSTVDGRVKVVSVLPELADGVLRVDGPGRGTLANVAANAEVTFCFPPLSAPGMTLLVDGAGRVEGESVLVTPATAVLHKPAV